jgi:hypothetical protein
VYLSVRIALMVCVCFTAGCCFDLTSVKQSPAQLQKSQQPKTSWILPEKVAVPLESWSTTHLNANTTWDYVGSIEQGEVYKSKNQTITIWGSNTFEAYLVIKDGKLSGFYLPVEKTFSSLSKPLEIKMSVIN